MTKKNSKKNKVGVVLAILFFLVGCSLLCFTLIQKHKENAHPDCVSFSVKLIQSVPDHGYDKEWILSNDMTIEAWSTGRFQWKSVPFPEDAEVSELEWTVQRNDSESGTKWVDADEKDVTFDYSQCEFRLNETSNKKTFRFTATDSNTGNKTSFIMNIRHGGWNRIGDNRHFIRGSGVMERNGWRPDDGEEKYLDEEGLIYYGWLQIKDENGKDRAYYLDEENKGAKVHGEIRVIDGQQCIFGSNGQVVSSWVKTDGNWYYYDSNGEMVRGKTLNIDGAERVFDLDGVLQLEEE